MASKGVDIKLTYADNQTLDKFRQVLAARMKWCNESARDSVAACAIDAIKSIRTKCKVAKKSSVKVNVIPDNSLIASFSTNGRRKTPVLRLIDGKTRYVPKENERIRFPGQGYKFNTLKVYRFELQDEDGDIKYIIAASNASEAKTIAKTIAVRRAMRYAGLAKRALGFLMQKTNTKRVNDPLNPVVEGKADEVTSKHESISKSGDGGTYALILTDVLRYALDAIKGGKSEIDASIKRAMNKIISVVN